MKYKKETEVVDAVQWHKEGDHFDVIKILITPEGTVREDSIIYDAWESSIDTSLVTLVYALETAEGLLPVTAGDYIITDAAGELSLCDSGTFEKNWKLV